MTPDDAAVLVLVAESWLRQLMRAGDPPLEPQVIAVLARLALAAPEVAARCPQLLRQIGASAAYRVYVLATAPRVSELAQAEADHARWLSTAAAAVVLGISRHGVRDLLRRGRLRGRRSPAGHWLADAAAVRRRARERPDRVKTAA